MTSSQLPAAPGSHSNPAGAGVAQMPETDRDRIIPLDARVYEPLFGPMHAWRRHSASIPSYPLHPGLRRWNACMGKKATAREQKRQLLLFVLPGGHQGQVSVRESVWVFLSR